MAMSTTSSVSLRLPAQLTICRERHWGSPARHQFISLRHFVNYLESLTQVTLYCMVGKKKKRNKAKLKAFEITQVNNVLVSVHLFTASI